MCDSIVPSEDAHQSEWVAASDKRREFISGQVPSIISSFIFRILTLTLYTRFTGTAGQAIISMHSAFLVTDSRYFLQAQEEIDSNWLLIKAGNPGEPQDWIEWIVVSLSFFLKQKTKKN